MSLTMLQERTAITRDAVDDDDDYNYSPLEILARSLKSVEFFVKSPTLSW